MNKTSHGLTFFLQLHSALIRIEMLTVENDKLKVDIELPTGASTCSSHKKYQLWISGAIVALFII
jgi:hypothetical protein